MSENEKKVKLVLCNPTNEELVQMFKEGSDSNSRYRPRIVIEVDKRLALVMEKNPHMTLDECEEHLIKNWDKYACEIEDINKFFHDRIDSLIKGE